MAAAGYLPGRSAIHRLDARPKLIFMLVIVALALVFTHPLYVLGLLALVLIIWRAAGLPGSFLSGLARYFTGIAVLIFAMQVFFYPGTTNLFRLTGPIPVIGFSGYVTLEGVMFGAALVLRLVVIMILAPLLVMTTPLPEFMLALVKLKVPYRFAFILTTAMSLLPSIQNRAALIQQAQRARGVPVFEGARLLPRLRASASMLVPLILGAFRDSQTLDVAMSSRAFGAPVPRTFLLESRLRAIDYGVLVAAALLLASAAALRIMHLGAV